MRSPGNNPRRDPPRRFTQRLHEPSAAGAEHSSQNREHTGEGIRGVATHEPAGRRAGSACSEPSSEYATEYTSNHSRCDRPLGVSAWAPSNFDRSQGGEGQLRWSAPVPEGNGVRGDPSESPFQKAVSGGRGDRNTRHIALMSDRGILGRGYRDGKQNGAGE
jgi:hypothetical protein